MKLLELFSGTHSIGKVCKSLDIDVVSLDRDLPEYDKTDKEKKYKSKKHYKEDILTWDYKKDYKPGDFDIITASPSCFYWSHLRKCWLNAFYNVDTMKFSRTEKEGFIKFTTKELQDDIDKYGKPQVDKVIEILEYFNPKYYWIENPKTSSMKNYLYDKGYNNDNIVSYCKYGFKYQKHTRIWTNIKGFTPKVCKNDCDSIITIKEDKKTHLKNCGNYERIKLAEEAIKKQNEEIKKHPQQIGGDSEKKLHPQSMGTSNDNQKAVGGGTNRLERYRIPPDLIKELLELCGDDEIKIKMTNLTI